MFKGIVEGFKANKGSIIKKAIAIGVAGGALVIGFGLLSKKQELPEVIEAEIVDETEETEPATEETQQ
jgi:hypothetical protein